MMMGNMDILMIVHTMGTLDPKDNDRFTYIARKILSVHKAAKIEIVTSDFEHHKKSYRYRAIAKKHPFDITFLHENAYNKNISIQRIIGHLSFAVRLKEYLEKRSKPDVIYCAVPPLLSANVVATYAKKNHIKLITDIQDLWPESFKIALGNSIVSDILLSPLSLLANRIYKKSDVIFAVSETFADRARSCCSKTSIVKSVFLGTDLTEIDNSIIDIEKKPVDEFWIAYVGNIGASYDFETLFSALSIVKKELNAKIVLHILGDGDMRKSVENLSKKYFSDTVFYGYLPYDEMFSVLKSCDIAVNPIVKNSVSSIVNKVGDYAAAGIATINTQNSKEYRRLLKKYNAGVNTKPENPRSLANAIIRLYRDTDMCKEMGINNRKLYDDYFDRSRTYTAIVKEMLYNSED